MSDHSKFPSRVVPMTEHERARRLRPLTLIESYWHALASEAGGIPFRNDVDPRGIQDALEYAFLAERAAPRVARLRVAGAHLSDLMGMEVAGLPLSAFLMPDSRDPLGDGICRAFAQNAALCADLQAATSLGRPDLSAHLLLMPLRSESGEIDRALGGLVSVGRIGRVPRRFNLVDLTVRAVEVPSGTATDPMSSGFAEDRAPYRPSPVNAEARDRTPARPAHLRLVVSND
ncbi:PAS domain protein [Roseivivax jejudonensis]|uniref:PAS domain protein n=1 Tax=Roseivivax jejudonensis TaxID=1529041 RepID=A0A1X6YNU6_9RHOB|nr:PAS domain-containing protein [Roseivivax jejudonensis]SLN26958.1 PAS domain protein [Roseivivax jejudonensis]